MCATNDVLWQAFPAFDSVCLSKNEESVWFGFRSRMFMLILKKVRVSLTATMRGYCCWSLITVVNYWSFSVEKKVWGMMIPSEQLRVGSVWAQDRRNTLLVWGISSFGCSTLLNFKVITEFFKVFVGVTSRFSIDIYWATVIARLWSGCATAFTVDIMRSFLIGPSLSSQAYTIASEEALITDEFFSSMAL